jgi:hypothetical protein
MPVRAVSRRAHRAFTTWLDLRRRSDTHNQEVEEMLHRTLSALAATAAALALSASPALAQDDDDDDDGGGAVQAAPQGGVQTGAGGMADQGPGWALAGLAAGSLALVAGAGGLTLRRRETQ